MIFGLFKTMYFFILHFEVRNLGLKEAESLDKNNEGFVIRYQSGLRLKIKGGEYRRLQKLIAGVTPIGLWELMREQSDLSLIRQEIPEEYWTDFDNIHEQLTQQLNDLIDEVETYHLNYQHLSDKELGLRLNSLPTIPKAYLFQRRKKGETWYKMPKIRGSLFNQFLGSRKFVKLQKNEHNFYVLVKGELILRKFVIGEQTVTFRKHGLTKSRINPLG